MSSDLGAPGPICGIDLGTTFSSIGFLNAFGRAEVIPTADGAKSIPSVVLFDPDNGEAIVGREAKERSVECPDRVVEFVKREMGDPDWVFRVDDRELRPQTISAVILRKLADLAESTLGQRPEATVITCPAYFGDLERQATADAGTLAGLEVLSVFNEPTAAALAYGLHHAAKDDSVRALVYDLGGGTFDVTILELKGRRVEVLATAGEHRLGGKDWDDEIMNYVAEEFDAKYGLDPRDDLGATQDLRNRCEAAKVSLSSKIQAKVFCRAYDKLLKLNFTRVLFDELTKPLLLQTKTYLDAVLDMAKLRWTDIDVVLPVGGSSHMPQVRQLLRECVGREPEDVLDPDLAVVQGAVYYAALLRAEQGFSIQVRKVQQPWGRKQVRASEELPSLPAASPVIEEEEEELPALPPATLEDAPEVLPALPGAVAPAGGGESVFAVPMLPGATGGSGSSKSRPPRRTPSGRPRPGGKRPPGRPAGRPRSGAANAGALPPASGAASAGALPPASGPPGQRRRPAGSEPGHARPTRPGTRRPAAGRRPAGSEPGHARPTRPGQRPPARPGQRPPSRPGQRPPSRPGQRRPQSTSSASMPALPPQVPPPSSDLMPALPAHDIGTQEGGITDTATFDFRDLVALDEAVELDRMLEESAASAPLPTSGAAPPPPPPALPARKQRAVQQVNSRSLGVLIHKDGGPAVRIMIPRNSKLPAEHRSQFYTINDNQTGVKVVVLEGEELDPEQCARIGECVISGLPPRPRGQPVEIGYTYDEDGQIRVWARDLGSGVEALVELKREGALDRKAMAEAAEWLDMVSPQST